MSKALDYGSQGPYACILFDSTLKVVVCNPRHEKLMIQIIEMLIPGKHIESIEFLDKEKHGLEINEKSVTSYFCTRKFFRFLIGWWRVATRHHPIGGGKTWTSHFPYFCGQRRSWGMSGVLPW